MNELQVNRRSLIATGMFSGVLFAARPGFAQIAGSPGANLDPAQIDAIVERFMVALDIPGIAVGVLGASPTPFLKGYGVRTLGRPEPVDVHTRFAIASNTKAFTAAALALLVEDKKLSWDDPVRRYLPEFRMRDPVVSDMMTVRDLLVHRSGLSLGAGDLLFSRTTTTPPRTP